MPKVKTKISAKKYFAQTENSKVKRLHASQSHILVKRGKKGKRNLQGLTLVDITTNRKNIKIKASNIVTQNTAGSKGLFFNNEKCIKSVISPLTNTAGSKGVFAINKNQ